MEVVGAQPAVAALPGSWLTMRPHPPALFCKCGLCIVFIHLICLQRHENSTLVLLPEFVADDTLAFSEGDMKPKVALLARVKEIRDGKPAFGFETIETTRKGKPVQPKEPKDAATRVTSYYL